MAGIKLLIETGKWCDDKRNEFILMSDTLGVSMLVDFLNYGNAEGCTEFDGARPILRRRRAGTAAGRRHREGPAHQASLAWSPAAFAIPRAGRSRARRSTSGKATATASTTCRSKTA